MLYAEMSPLMRAMVGYESNGSLDQQCPHTEIARMAGVSSVARRQRGVAFFTMADIVATGNHPGVVSADPVTHEYMGMGSRGPLIRSHIDGGIQLALPHAARSAARPTPGRPSPAAAS